VVNYKLYQFCVGEPEAMYCGLVFLEAPTILVILNMYS